MQACAAEVLMLGDWRATAGEVGSWPEYGHLAGPTLGWKSHTGRPERKRFVFPTRSMGTARRGASALAGQNVPQHVASVPIRLMFNWIVRDDGFHPRLGRLLPTQAERLRLSTDRPNSMFPRPTETSSLCISDPTSCQLENEWTMFPWVCILSLPIPLNIAAREGSVNTRTSLDTAAARFVEIKGEATANIEGIVSEEDTKIQVITRILTDVLGWKYNQIRAEEKHANGYSDYVIRDANRAIVLVEAKRVGSLEVSLANLSQCRELKLNGSALRRCQDGIIQAAGYASPNGIPVAVLTDGCVWIILKPHVAGEPYAEKEAFVFPGLSAVEKDFSTFFDLISKEAAEEKRYKLLFDRLHNPRMFLTRPLVAAHSDSEIPRVRKNKILFDLDQVFDTFFSRMRGDEDPDLLIECFVETRESRIADFSLEKMTRQVLGNIVPEEKDVDQQLSRLIGQTVQQEHGESVFIVGPPGSGKTTFLERFFRKTLPSQIRAKVVPIRVNCLDASGMPESIQNWMTEKLINEIEGFCFPDGNPSWDELRGLYYREYMRRSKGVDAKLYARDREGFHEKFGAFMDEQVEKDREGYLRRLLSDVVRNRKKLPVIVVDNTDEFDLGVKKAIFQFAQALRRNARHCMIIQPVTDKSAWTFSKTDIFQIYNTKSFFLPTPPPREVFRRRIDYIKRTISDDPEGKRSGRYFSERGITISIGNLDNFASELEVQFVNHERTAKLLGEIANYNIRTTLNLARRVMTSSVFKIEDVLVARTAGEKRVVPWFRFLSALLKGDHVMYRTGDVPEVVNVFRVDDQIRQSPLIQLRILKLLETTANAARDVDGKHLTAGSIHDFFEVWGCSEASIDSALVSLVDSRLLEKFDPSISELSRDQKLAITHSGRAHLRLALEENVYFEQMALTTMLSLESVADEIRTEYSADSTYFARLRRVRNLFARHLVSEDAQEMEAPTNDVLPGGQGEIAKGIRRYLVGSEGTGESAQESKLTGIVATVDWFSTERGYGFADCKEIEGGVFLHKSVLIASGVENIRDGDDLVCSIEFADRGPQIVKIERIRTSKSDLIVTRCRVIRLFRDRGYGFVRPTDSTTDGRDAFFHVSVLEDEERRNLEEGDEMEVELKSDRNGTSIQVRRVLQVWRAVSGTKS